jgi:hypothetical protein
LKWIAAAALLISLPVPAPSQSRHPCADDAIAKALPLLKLHYEQLQPLDSNAIESKVKVLPPMRGRKGERLDVLEVWGHIYKSDYRMRFIYLQGCALVGQEILEASVLPARR